MTELTLQAEPGALGFSTERLGRIDRHFQQYVDDGRLPGWILAITRMGKLVHLATAGKRDLESNQPVVHDTLFRIYSMTKPVTSVVAMMQYEEGAFDLTDPVARFIPSFADVQVFRRGTPFRPETMPVSEPIRMWHLLTHTSGLTYGFHHAHPTDAIYRTAGYEWGVPYGVNLERACEEWARMPLVSQPGAQFNYGVSTDVLGRVIEIIAGKPLDEVFAERVLEPLGMHDTTFSVGDAGRERLAALYTPDPVTGKAVRNDHMGRGALARPEFLSGGGGLVSSMGDYLRFAEMLRRGGTYDGKRLLGSRTLKYMTVNHLPGGADLSSFGRGNFTDASTVGVGFGLGFSVMQDPVKNRVLCSAGEFGWGGAASTTFLVDPMEELVVVFLTQLLPSATHPIPSQLRQLVYQSLVD